MLKLKYINKVVLIEEYDAKKFYMNKKECENFLNCISSYKEIKIFTTEMHLVCRMRLRE
jgi:hypothetical protein